ncbi:hypothetical protein PGTUg99_034179 [Puccinia graminis f. sp. tritici]|uniref:Uncharacterized protein n=1 Tax=Puccinia graminis f. sp. tritici TaxID=56615 RepID=A0A5B0N1Q2_PUCGR|nr:hypothetical protein PGTUg99_034179 [Puccinia graminis f. sp. tritici]
MTKVLNHAERLYKEKREDGTSCMCYGNEEARIGFVQILEAMWSYVRCRGGFCSGMTDKQAGRDARMVVPAEGMLAISESGGGGTQLKKGLAGVEEVGLRAGPAVLVERAEFRSREWI